LRCKNDTPRCRNCALQRHSELYLWQWRRHKAGLSRRGFILLITLPRSPESRLLIAVLGLLLVVRVSAILLSPLNLYADEAQYWRWAQSLAWGYYSPG
jgi:hypothetical protein